MFTSKTTLLIIIILLLGFLFLWAQDEPSELESGRIQGYVTDKATGEAMIGANILLEGTGLGAATDFDGYYIINNVPIGSYTLVVRYLGYQSYETPIEVTSGQTILHNISLVFQIIEGEEIVVTAQAEGQMQAINQQLTSRTIKNVVHAERIQELPDESAAAALSRLPGVSLQEGDKVVIRGLQAKMNTVLINGFQLPSTDMEDRSTNLGFISSNMLEGIEVIKVLTPDMDANALGGVVNLKIREAPVGLNFDVLSQGTFNHQDRTTDNYKLWGSVSQRFLDNKLGVFIQGNADRTNGGLDQTSAGYAISNNNLDYGHSPYFMNSFVFIDEENIITNYGGSIVIDYKLPAGKIILQNTLAHTINDNARHRLLFSFLSPIDATYSIWRDKHNKELLINAIQTEYNFGDVKAELSLSHSYSDKNTDIRYGDPGNNFGFVNAWTEAHFISPTGDTLNADDFQQDDRLRLKTQDVYDMVIPDDNWKNAAMTDWCVTRSEAFKQHLYNTTLDFTIPASFLDYVSGNIKFGGKFTHSTRTNDADETYHRVGDSDFYYAVTDFVPGKYLEAIAGDPNGLLTLGDIKNYVYNRGKYYLNGDYEYKYAFDTDRLDKFMVDVQDGWDHIPAHLAKSERDDFDGTETFSAGYLMGNFNIGPRLSFIGGLRYEHYNMDYKANFIYVTHAVDGDRANFDTLNIVDRNDDDFFPNAQLRYKYADWGDVRIAYTKSIIRPDYKAIIPNTYYVPGTGSVNGNTLLKPTISDNYDIHFSFYNNEIGLFTIGGFYKKMQDVFFQSNIYFQNLHLYNVSFPDSSTWIKLGFPDRDQWPSKADVITTFLNNPNPAHVKGIEIEWQTHFWYLPRPFNACVLNVNYARVWSEMDYQQIENWQESYTYIDPRTGRLRTGTRYHSTDTVRTARLLNQGDHIVNVALGIDYKDFSGRLSFNLQSDVISYIGVRPEADQYTGNVYKWDITFRQKLPIPGLSIAFNGVNIFHNVKKEYQKFPNSEGGSIKENLYRTTYSPRKFELNLRYSF